MITLILVRRKGEQSRYVKFLPLSRNSNVLDYIFLHPNADAKLEHPDTLVIALSNGNNSAPYKAANAEVKDDALPTKE